MHHRCNPAGSVVAEYPAILALSGSLQLQKEPSQGGDDGKNQAKYRHTFSPKSGTAHHTERGIESVFVADRPSSASGPRGLGSCIQTLGSTKVLVGWMLCHKM